LLAGAKARQPTQAGDKYSNGTKEN
jgi:hypothetical protein